MLLCESATSDEYLLTSPQSSHLIFNNHPDTAERERDTLRTGKGSAYQQEVRVAADFVFALPAGLVLPHRLLETFQDHTAPLARARQSKGSSPANSQAFFCQSRRIEACPPTCPAHRPATVYLHPCTSILLTWFHARIQSKVGW